MYEYDFSEAPVVIQSYDGFRILEVKGRQYIDCRDPQHGMARDYIVAYLHNEIDSETVEDFAHRYPVSFLIDYIHLLERMDGRNKNELIKFLKAEKQKRVRSYSERQKKGLVEMGDVETVFSPGTEIVFATGDDGLIGGIVKNIKIQHSWFAGTYFEIKLSVIHAVKGEVQQGFYTVRMPGFYGMVPLNSLPLRFPATEDKKKLTDRGKKFAQFWKPGTYCAYKGTLVQPSWWSMRTYRADGRVVIDPISFERQEPEGWRNCVQTCGVNLDREEERTSKLKKTADIDEADYWRCVPQLYGFALSVKQWGRLEIDGMSEIQWRDDAWDKLVVAPEEKDMIYSLVKFHGTGFTDIIEGKGGGTIFLLHGKPGWGKTASAEAVAELLHKPLYSVGVGELGVNTETLEAKLRNILDVAVIWDAVLLLDEADIFLEERDDHNIHRNAMVGVFLRLLEYHNGVLFLTTNRVKKIDPAFFSRISVALHYRPEGKALPVWTNLLTAAGLNPEWAKELYTYDVNGRQIKNSIRMAQTLARSKGRKVQVSDLKRAVTAALRFETEMKATVDATPKKKRTKKSTTDDLVAESLSAAAASNGE
jgi:hypothetical protein